MIKIAATVVLSLTVGACSFVGVRDAYQQLPYTVVEELGDAVEIRRYAPRLVAEVTVDSPDADKGTSEAFGLLFDYITGDNAPNTKIEMTSPVAVTGAGTEIEMTTPVETAVAGDSMTMRFFLPPSFSETTVPQPTNSRVKIVILPEQTIAALGYSGFRDARRATKKIAVLREILATNAWRPAGDATSYYYDPPWTLPWFRRNEAIVPVAFE